MRKQDFESKFSKKILRVIRTGPLCRGYPIPDPALKRPCAARKHPSAGIQTIVLP